MLDPSVGAVLLEPLQGEGGVNPADADYVRGVRTLCDERGILLIFDEVQTGFARTGKWFGFEHFGIRPDIVTMAKALGNGMPIGACWARPTSADAFKPGDHGTTFGGQPLAASAARAVLQVMQDIDAPALSAERARGLAQALRALPGVADGARPRSAAWASSSSRSARRRDGEGRRQRLSRCRPRRQRRHEHRAAVRAADQHQRAPTCDEGIDIFAAVLRSMT